ncbi:MAG: Uma2 family endonuclease [Treponema sp.]|nr:Uma2 family endonuclease [Treponema sp.]MCL2251600.1 Uma2 family endonuclease [Treponema sp.]
MAIAEKIQDETPAVYSLEEPRFERLFGVEYAMSSPSFKHQVSVGRLFTLLDSQLSIHNCKTIVAPFDVYPLYDKGDEYTLVQPDVFLSCDNSKLKENCYKGSPKFIIEILSSNRSHDMVTKLNLYEKAGVNEYWIIDPEEQIIITFELVNGRYVCRNYLGEDEVTLVTVPGCTIDFKKVFAD